MSAGGFHVIRTPNVVFVTVTFRTGPGVGPAGTASVVVVEEGGTTVKIIQY